MRGWMNLLQYLSMNHNTFFHFDIQTFDMSALQRLKIIMNYIQPFAHWK